MSIKRQHENFSLVCDICGIEASEQFANFLNIYQYQKDNSWRSENKQDEHGAWNDVCPICQILDNLAQTQGVPVSQVLNWATTRLQIEITNIGLIEFDSRWEGCGMLYHSAEAKTVRLCSC
jgi:hypothetical protein